MKRNTLHSMAMTLGAIISLSSMCWAQVNSGSNGSDGALDLSAYSGMNTNIVINMADRPTGIYNYTSVTIPTGVTVSFIPNANNTPVTWLVQSNCTISGTVDVSGQKAINGGALGGPGGYSGGNSGTAATSGGGPGGGGISPTTSGYGGNASYGTVGNNSCASEGGIPGEIYGNDFVVQLLGGSGGGGSFYGFGRGGGGGGGGAILIAASNTITIQGGIRASGGWPWFELATFGRGGAGSGGAVRLVGTTIAGSGYINVNGGQSWCGLSGQGRVRLDAYTYSFTGIIDGTFSHGSQFEVLPVAGQGAQLTIASVAGVAVTPPPTGVLATPDAVIAAQQANPIPIVVQCSNIPLNTPITVKVKPANGSPVSAVGYNTTGTTASSTATVLINMPRGGGIMYATAVGN